MLDIIKMNYSEYRNVVNNSFLVIRKNSAYFNEIFKTKEIALNPFILAVEKMILQFSYNTFKEVLNVKIINERGRQIGFTAHTPQIDLSDFGVTFHVKYDFGTEGDQMWWQAKCQESDQTPLTVAANFARSFWAINFYLKNLPEVVETINEKAEETYVENKKGNKRYKSRTVLRKTIYIHAKPFTKRDVSHAIKCLCWGVRGHFRHTKNGKAIWIKPYRKGKERNNENVYVGKEYVMEATEWKDIL